jgi:anti-sigma regulatory factor (Ser/Thr protein kinase)
MAGNSSGSWPDRVRGIISNAQRHAIVTRREKRSSRAAVSPGKARRLALFFVFELPPPGIHTLAQDEGGGPGVAVVVAHDVPTSSSTMAVRHGPESVRAARRRLREDLGEHLVPEPVIDDAVLILSELLSNACRHARPLEREQLVSEEREEVLVGWELHSDGLLTVEVTDGGGPTRPRRGHPSLTAKGGRGLGIVGQLASDWGVRDDAPGEVTVWAVLRVRARHARLEEPSAAAAS